MKGRIPAAFSPVFCTISGIRAAGFRDGTITFRLGKLLECGESVRKCDRVLRRALWEHRDWDGGLTCTIFEHGPPLPDGVGLFMGPAD